MGAAHDGYPRSGYRQQAGMRPPLTGAQRREIAARYRAAVESEPGLSKSAFARRMVTEYPASAQTIRKAL